MKQSKEITIEVEVCDKCGDELFIYKDNGNPPQHIFGVYWGDNDTAYCENTCMPEE